MTTAEIAWLLEEARPSARLRRQEPREAERRRIEAINGLRKIWRGQIGRFTRAQCEEMARYRVAEEAARKAVEKAERETGLRDRVRVRFERKEVVRADYVDARLDLYFAEVGRDLIAAQHPEAAMTTFLGHAKRPGRPTKTAVDADVGLILRFRDLLTEGMKAEGALRHIAQEAMTSSERRKPGGEDRACERIRAQLRRAKKSRPVREALAERASKFSETLAATALATKSMAEESARG